MLQQGIPRSKKLREYSLVTFLALSSQTVPRSRETDYFLISSIHMTQSSRMLVTYMTPAKEKAWETCRNVSFDLFAKWACLMN